MVELRRPSLVALAICEKPRGQVWRRWGFVSKPEETIRRLEMHCPTGHLTTQMTTLSGEQAVPSPRCQLTSSYGEIFEEIPSQLGILRRGS